MNRYNFRILEDIIQIALRDKVFKLIRMKISIISANLRISLLTMNSIEFTY